MLKNRVFVECKPDFLLVKTLGIPEDQIIHGASKSGVFSKLRKKATNSIGLVDEDPESGRPRFFDKLQVIAEIHDIVMLYDRERSNYLIILKPRLEDWIIKTVSESDLELKSFGLSSEARKLHVEINTQLYQYKKLLETLVNHKNERFECLKTMFNKLKDL